MRRSAHDSPLLTKKPNLSFEEPGRSPGVPKPNRTQITLALWALCWIVLGVLSAEGQQTITCSVSGADPSDPTAYCVEPSPESPATCPDNWGLEMIDQRSFECDGLFTYGADGTGAHVYVVDSGITSQAEFGPNVITDCGCGREGGGIWQCTGGCYYGPGVPGLDDNFRNSHGTRVASLIAGRTFGAAKGATLHPVKMCAADPPAGGCSFALSQYLLALDWIIENHEKPAVVNVSLNRADTQMNSDVFFDRVRSMIEDHGITVVTSAGNQDGAADPSDFVPSNVPGAIVVGAVDRLGRRWHIDPGVNDVCNAAGECQCENDGACGSNLGPNIDVWAPGALIRAAVGTRNDRPVLLSGTSFAAPLVTAVAAIYLAGKPTATPSEVKDAILDSATFGILSDLGAGSPNLFMYSKLTPRDGGGIPNVPPVANFVFSCTDLFCDFDAGSSWDADGILHYTWDFGDGSVNQVLTVPLTTHLFPATGNYTVRLTVTDARGLPRYIEREVSVVAREDDQPPTAFFTHVCVGSTCTLHGTGSSDDVGVVAWEWTFGDGSSGTGSVVVHTYTDGFGSHRIWLTVTDTGGQTAKKTARIYHN